MSSPAVPLLDPTKGVKFRGGCFTDRDVDMIPMGGYSMIQNMRPVHDGFEMRKGCRALHTVADGTNRVESLYMFSKGRVAEKHFYAQMSDGDVLEATANPPDITTGAFGSAAFAGTSTGQIPASWSSVDDIMVYSNGSDQHQLYPGDDPYVSRFIVYRGAETVPLIPTKGEDFTEQATDGLTTTEVDMSSLGDLGADYDCLLFCTKLPATSLKFVLSAVNDTASVAAGKYFNGTEFTDVSGFTDGTSASSKTLAKSGSMSWTAPTDEKPHYMFGMSGFWYMIYLSSGDLGSAVKATSVQYNTTFQSLVNVWDGVPVRIIESLFYDDSAGTTATYGSDGIEVSSMTSSDKLYFASRYPIYGLYVDVGDTPNTTSTTTVNSLYYWDGADFSAASDLADGTYGFKQSGYITFTRPSDIQKKQHGDLQYYLYWYYITVDKTLSSDVSISIKTIPYFDINEFGSAGMCSCAWKDRMVYTFNRYPNDLYVTARHMPMSLNGDDFKPLDRPGDGRANKVVCIKRFYSEILVWQEEKGTDGGTLTLYQGYDPESYGKFVLSTKFGTFNAKSAVVVEGVMTWNKDSDNRQVTMAFFLSHEGVFACDGQNIMRISKSDVSSIQNYFNPNKAECIRNGYENKMWLKYDSSRRVLRLGLVSGSSATECNIFPVYDIDERGWSFDKLAQEFSCIEEVEGEDAVTVLQVAGGIDDGTVYQSNYGENDVATAIDAYVMMELDANGAEMLVRDFIVRKTGALTVTPYEDGVAKTAITIDS